MSHQSDEFPAPPPSPEVVERKALPHKRNLWVPIVMIAVLVGILYTACASQAPVEVKPTPSASPAPVSNDKPCSHESFDADACAVRIVMVASQQYEASPDVVVQSFCSRWSTKKAQKEQIRSWVKQGAYRAEARAVIDKILQYCRPA